MISECLCKPMDMEPRHFYPDAKIVKSRGSLRMPIFHLQIDFFFFLRYLPCWPTIIVSEKCVASSDLFHGQHTCFLDAFRTQSLKPFPYSPAATLDSLAFKFTLALNSQEILLVST